MPPAMASITEVEGSGTAVTVTKELLSHFARHRCRSSGWVLDSSHSQGGNLMTTPLSLNDHPRPSSCINRSKALERQRIEKLSVEERIRMALSLKQRIANLLPGPDVSDPNATVTRPA